jgi:type I site-specific restriction endonuclease
LILSLAHAWFFVTGISSSKLCISRNQTMADRTFADYVLGDRHGRAMAVVEAKLAAYAETGIIPA